MGLAVRLGNAWRAFRGLDHASYYGSSWTGGSGGPSFSDAWQYQRSPSPARLVEAYKSLIYACANLNVQGVVRCPLRLYAVSGGMMGPAPRSACGPRKVPRTRLPHLRRVPHVARAMQGAEAIDEVTNHPTLAALDDPNDEFDRATLIEYTALCLEISGRAYWQVNPPAGVPAEFWPLAPQMVTPQRDQLGTGEKALPYGYSYLGGNLTPEQVIRFRLIAPKDPYADGYGPTQAAFAYAGLEDKFVAIQDQVLGQGPRPSLLLSAKDPKLAPSEDERNRFEQSINRRLSGPKAARALVTNGAYDVTPVSYPPADVSGVTISTYDMERTANCFGVPIPLLSSQTNLANLQAAEKQHGKTIERRCNLIAASLTRFARRFDRRLFFAFDPACPEDEMLRAKVFDIKAKAGAATINEWRAEDGYEPVEWGDEPWMPSTLRQPSEERPQPPAIGQGQPPKSSEDDDEEPPETEKAEADADPERELRERLTRILDRIDADLNAGSGDAAAAPHAAQAETRPARRSPGAAEGAAGWEADRGIVEGRVSGTTGAGDPRPPERGDTEPNAAPATGGAAHVGTDDADPGGVLGRGGEGDPDEPGPGSGCVEGDGPALEGDGPDGGPGLLQGDERDDQ